MVSYIKQMDNKKIAFIICTNNMQYYEECVRYIQELEIPEGFGTDILCIQEASSMAEGCNGGMQSSDAKYKVYLHQDTFIINRNFIGDILRIFEEEQIGMIGVLGADKLLPNAEGDSDWNVGNVMVYSGRYAEKIGFWTQNAEQEWTEVEAVSGVLMATQYDIPWREDIFDGWDLYDISQSLEMRRQGYRVVVPYQKTPWCYHDCGCHESKNAAIYWSKLRQVYGERICERPEQKKKNGYQQEIKGVSKQLVELLAGHQYEALKEIAEKMREKWLPDTEIREVMNLMEIYSLESASVNEKHSEWFELWDWERIRQYYNWVRFVVLRMEYEREDERVEELKEMVEEGRISRDALRKISAVM